MSTSEKILEMALKLFSKRGYTAVSIRDICKEVGIKESTIYYHFKNKQEIFDVLCKSFTDVSYALPRGFTVEMHKVAAICEEDFLSVAQHFLNDYLMDDKVNQFLRMLIIEQNTNPQAASIYHRMMFDEALALQKGIFGWLIQINFLKDSPIDSMVMDYYAPIVYYFHRYLVSQPITEEIKTKVNQKLTSHVQYFLRKYKL